jgi:hypothetical protein
MKIQITGNCALYYMRNMPQNKRWAQIVTINNDRSYVRYYASYKAANSDAHFTWQASEVYYRRHGIRLQEEQNRTAAIKAAQHRRRTKGKKQRAA